ncbi:hypothetical protein GGR57DRAFT_508360 [Xylariaceae sp. FL1272]|nr:hypothetical protein GGR57DRAFT_508360 [Xylariaceae sp. FL1272]
MSTYNTPNSRRGGSDGLPATPPYTPPPFVFATTVEERDRIIAEEYAHRLYQQQYQLGPYDPYPAIWEQWRREDNPPPPPFDFTRDVLGGLWAMFISLLAFVFVTVPRAVFGSLYLIAIAMPCQIIAAKYNKFTDPSTPRMQAFNNWYYHHLIWRNQISWEIWYVWCFVRDLAWLVIKVSAGAYVAYILFWALIWNRLPAWDDTAYYYPARSSAHTVERVVERVYVYSSPSADSAFETAAYRPQVRSTGYGDVDIGETPALDDQSVGSACYCQTMCYCRVWDNPPAVVAHPVIDA